MPIRRTKSTRKTRNSKRRGNKNYKTKRNTRRYNKVRKLRGGHCSADDPACDDTPQNKTDYTKFTENVNKIFKIGEKQKKITAFKTEKDSGAPIYIVTDIQDQKDSVEWPANEIINNYLKQN